MYQIRRVPSGGSADYFDPKETPNTVAPYSITILRILDGEPKVLKRGRERGSDLPLVTNQMTYITEAVEIPQGVDVLLISSRPPQGTRSTAI